MSNYTDKIADFKTDGAFSLAGPADCMSPDSPTSPGALFLGRVRDDVIERVEDITDLSDFERETEELTHEIADNAVPIYTADKWATFVDLGAYQEDVSELAGDEGDMDKLGSIALYVIAERLVQAILSDLTEAIAEDVEEVNALG